MSMRPDEWTPRKDSAWANYGKRPTMEPEDSGDWEPAGGTLFDVLMLIAVIVLLALAGFAWAGVL